MYSSVTITQGPYKGTFFICACYIAMWHLLNRLSHGLRSAPIRIFYLGYQGVVQECTEVNARVTLDSVPKTITVERSKLLIRNKDGTTSSAAGLDTRRMGPPPGAMVSLSRCGTSFFVERARVFFLELKTIFP